MGGENYGLGPGLRLGPDQVGQVRGLMIALPPWEGGGEV